jgi:hypothetical protein
VQYVAHTVAPSLGLCEPARAKRVTVQFVLLCKRKQHAVIPAHLTLHSIHLVSALQEHAVTLFVVRGCAELWSTVHQHAPYAVPCPAGCWTLSSVRMTGGSWSWLWHSARCGLVEVSSLDTQSSAVTVRDAQSRSHQPRVI